MNCPCRDFSVVPFGNSFVMTRCFNIYSRITPINDRRSKISNFFNAQIGVYYSRVVCHPGPGAPDFQILPAYFGEKAFFSRLANLGIFHQNQRVGGKTAKRVIYNKLTLDKYFSPSTYFDPINPRSQAQNIQCPVILIKITNMNQTC